jgi:hypothetical protein
LFALSVFAQSEPPLTAIASRDQKVVRRWKVEGEPRGLAVGKDGTLYVGLAAQQAVLAVDPKSGAVLRKVVLDHAEIAATKELVSLRMNRERTRLYVANGSDESATILGLPDLHVIREITIEGERIRDAVPDPKGRYLYLLGRRVHVYDASGETELKTLPLEEPMALAAAGSGNVLAVIGTHDFGNAKATVAAMFDPRTFTELAREPLQTTEKIEAATFSGDDRALVALSREHLFEKPVIASAAKTMTKSGNGPMRMTLDFGDLVNSDRICLPTVSGPQIVTPGAGDMLLFAERRCNSSGSFSGSSRKITPASLYGVDAYAIAYDSGSNTLAATEAGGVLTIYRVPRPAIAH